MILDENDMLPQKPLPDATVHQLAAEPTTPWVAFGPERLARSEISILNMALNGFLGSLNDKARMGELTEAQEKVREECRLLIDKLSALRMRAAEAEERLRETKTATVPTAKLPPPSDPTKGTTTARGLTANEEDSCNACS